jgi:hypothetical protein
LFVPTPSISLNFSLDGLLAPSESADEVINSLCNIYVRFLPRLRALYQQYSKIQWADDKTITALRMVGMWRFLQDKGSILDPDFRLSDADDVIQWSLEPVSVIKADLASMQDAPAMRSTYGFDRKPLDLDPASLKNEPLSGAADPFATLFLYQLFEALVRLAHHRLSETFPDSLILQVTRFLENSILMPEDEPPKNIYSIFRKSISTALFDDVVTRFSPTLIQLYLEFAGYASGCSQHQIRQLEAGVKIDPRVDVMVDESFHGLMTIRDLILFLGDRGFFSDQRHLRVLDVLLFQRYGSVTRELVEGEEESFRKFFTSFTRCRVTFVEFVQTLAFVGSKLVRFEWPLEKKFEYVVEHIDGWKKPQPLSPEDVIPDEEEEVHEPPPPPPPEKPEKHSRNR